MTADPGIGGKTKLPVHRQQIRAFALKPPQRHLVSGTVIKRPTRKLVSDFSVTRIPPVP